MSKHTEGPWQVETGGYGTEKGFFPDELFVTIDGANMAICSDIIDPETGELSIENARLIAAAPDLLEALEDMLSGWKYIRESHGDLYGVGWDRAQDKATAAITRARGEV